MSERTTIGGTVYETVGSSSSNLLLKCNGTARIQWGNKLIDLIKNGKIASGETSETVSIVSDESDIKTDGIYVIKKGNDTQLYIYKNGEKINLNGADLYISASTKQDITVEQQKQALENIGIYYNTLEDVKNAGIINGLVYVLEDQNLYTIQDGIISEFEAKLKTVTVEKENEEGDIINSSIKIILSILDDEYLVLENKRITANYDVHVRSTAQLGSEGANEANGYRLFINGGTSWLEVDQIKVRDGLPSQEYIETTYANLSSLISLKQLQPHKWYLITDYRNPWKLYVDKISFNRPILVRALTNSSFYKEGMLFKDRRVTIQFDPLYNVTFSKVRKDNDTFELDSDVTTRGCVTWMKDAYGNEANFDFLDYIDVNSNHITTLHKSTEHESLDLSIFPKFSTNNKLTIYDLKGLYIHDGILDFDSASSVNFAINDSDDNYTTTKTISNNIIECRGFTLTSRCSNFYNNTLKETAKLVVDTPHLVNCNLSSVYNLVDGINDIPSVTDSTNDNFDIVELKTNLDTVTMKGLINSTYSKQIENSSFGTIKKSKIYNWIRNSNFGDIDQCTLYDEFNKVQFKNLTDCDFGTQSKSGKLENITCYSDISDYQFIQGELQVLYDISKTKEVYYNLKPNSQSEYILQVLVASEQTFTRGMIVMHSGIEPIPTGWAVCDGNEYIWEGKKTTTPKLIDRFIKAVGIGAQSEPLSKYVEPVDNKDLKGGKFTLKAEHLPHHEHPHTPHTHNITINSTGSISIPTYNLSTEVENVEIMDSETTTHIPTYKLETTSENKTVSLRSTGVCEDATSMEKQQDKTVTSFNIEPNYYALIFIMKL